MKDFTNSPVFVTGIERSGSSLIARILNICGAFSGNTTEMFENKKVSSLLDNYYRFYSADTRGQYPLIESTSLLIPHGWKETIVGNLEKEGYKGEQWFLKGSRLGQIWPVWHYAFPDAKWIIVRRRTGDIIQSCMKTAYMDAYENPDTLRQIKVDSPEKGWLWWVHQHENRFVELMNAGANVKVIWPDRMVNGDYSQIHEMLDWLGLKWNTRVLTEIDPLLQKERRR